jgi:3D (Asp-Asp-Asp) domain-containing protein
MSLPFTATAYGPPWNAENGTGKTATGIQLAAQPTGQAGPYIVAVDPSVIPLGSKLKIWPNPFGDPNIVFSAQDTGGAIQGSRIDFLDMISRASQDSWGVRPVQVTVLGPGTPGLDATATTTPTTPAAATSASATSVPASSSPEWAKLLLSAALLGLGVAFARKGLKGSLETAKAA